MSGIQPGGKRGKKAAAAAAAARGDDSDELTKEETQIARFLRFNGPKKQGNLLGIKVDFFVSSKLIDLLMESKWGPKNNAAPFLANRNACVALMERFMNKQLFYRAVKIYKESSSPSDENKVHISTIFIYYDCKLRCLPFFGPYYDLSIDNNIYERGENDICRRRFKQAEQKCVLIDYKYNYYFN